MKIERVKEDTEEGILREIKDIYGIEKCKDTIKSYIQYLKLRSKNKIDIGNCNVIIKCSNDYSQVEQLVQAIIRLLKLNNIADSSYLYVDGIQLRNSYRNNDVENAEVFIVDSDIVNIYDRRLQNKIQQCIQTNQNKVFIFVDKENCFWKEDVDSRYIFWTFELEEPSEKDKENRIEQLLKSNDIELDSKCNMIDLMSKEDVEDIERELADIIIECKTKQIDKITNKVLRELDKSKYLQGTNTEEENTNKTGMQELNALEGLDEVKQQIQQVLNYIKVNKDRGKLPSLHMSFEGNPGCGKTVCARIIGKIFSEEKILSDRNKFTEIHARDLVAKYVGWTAKQTEDIIARAEGGVLFIDEAYALYSERASFEQEAIDTLIKLMEDKRDKICIIFAGYKKDMEKLFAMNAGFASRINFHIQFPNYNEEELYNIFKKMIKQDQYRLATNAKDTILGYLRTERQCENFANGRTVRNLFEQIKMEQANRVVTEKSEDIDLIKKCDVQAVINRLQKEQPVKLAQPIGFRCS